MSKGIKTTESWYEMNYREKGFDAQRRYPNEELLHFMGDNFFDIPLEKRNDKRILEIG